MILMRGKCSRPMAPPSRGNSTATGSLPQHDTSVENASMVTIGGILANAAALGAGADVTAVVRVNGEAVHTGTLKLADVKPDSKFRK